MEVKRLLQHATEHARATEKEVLNYNKALLYLESEVQQHRSTLTHQLVCTVQKMVVDGLITGKGKARGTYYVLRE